jgi:hypothetical protein
MERAPLPPRPVLDAQFAADFVERYRELEENERIVGDMWAQLIDALHGHEDAIKSLHKCVFAPEPPGLLDMQACVHRVLATYRAVAPAASFLRQAWAVAGPGLDDMSMLAADVLAHRPAQMALFTHPGAPLQAPIDTPTLGPRLTDDQVLLEDYGLNFF